MGNNWLAMLPAGGACRAKLGQCILKCPMERCKQRKAARAASLAASQAGDLGAATSAAVDSDSLPAESPAAASMLEGPQLSLRDSISSLGDSQDGDLDVIGQQPTGVVGAAQCSFCAMLCWSTAKPCDHHDEL